MISTTNPRKRYRGPIVLLFWLLVWQIAALAVDQELLLVSPVQVCRTLGHFLRQPDFWATVGYSFVRIVSGFLLALLAGILLAAVSAANRIIRALLDPFFSVIRSIPVASFIILVLIWSGSGYLSVVISFLMVLPIVYTNVQEGILRTNKQLLEMARVFRVSPGRQIFAIFLPGIMPYFVSACRIGLGLCWKSGIAAEVIGLPTGSIGEQLYQAKIFFSTGELFGWTLVIITISYLFEKIFLMALAKAERRLAGEAGRERQA